MICKNFTNWCTLILLGVFPFQNRLKITHSGKYNVFKKYFRKFFKNIQTSLKVVRIIMCGNKLFNIINMQKESPNDNHAEINVLKFFLVRNFNVLTFFPFSFRKSFLFPSFARERYTDKLTMVLSWCCPAMNAVAFANICDQGNSSPGIVHPKSSRGLYTLCR